MAYQYRGEKKFTAAELLAMERAKAEAVKAKNKLENVEFLLGTGCPVEDALRRSGYETPEFKRALDAFKKTAVRQGRQDLVRHVSERLSHARAS